MSPKEYIETNIESAKLPIKSVIVIVLWIGSLVGVYYKMQSNVERAQNMAIEAIGMSKENQSKWNSSNIALLTFRVDELTASVKELSKSTNEVKDLLRARR